MLLSSGLCVSEGPWAPTKHLTSDTWLQQCLASSQLLLSHSTYCHLCPTDTKQNTALPSSVSKHRPYQMAVGLYSAA